MELALPLKDIQINQPFGVNFVNFYTKMGLRGHNGIDFRAEHNPAVYASHKGIVVTAGKDGDGGICVEILSQRMGEGYKTIYYHLKDVTVKVDQLVKTGEIIGHADNTGKYTTGDHLHFGLKFTKGGVTIFKENGYNGAIDPSIYFPKDWDKSNAYKRYGRERNWSAYLNEVKVMVALRAYLKKKPSFEQINACVYGGWDRETVKDDAMYSIWGFETKTDYKNGKLTF